MSDREIDVLVAELMGWERLLESWYDEEGVDGCVWTSPSGEEYRDTGWDFVPEELPAYTTSHAAAMSVVEKLISNGWQFSLNVVDSQPEAMFWKGPTPKSVNERQWALEQIAGVGFASVWSQAVSPPMAVCLAALAAVGAGVPA